MNTEQLKEKFVNDYIPFIEELIRKEKIHKANLEQLKLINGVAKRKYIYESEKALAHYERRLAEYKNFVNELQ